MAKPEISVIVCHHTGELLFGFLESVFKSKDVSFEVIVLTSNKQLALDGIKGCLVIHNEGLPAKKRNSGARVARGKYLAFFDDDVTIDENCLWHLKDMIKESVVMSFGKLWNMEHRERFDEAGGYLTWTGFIWSRAGQNDIDKGQYDNEDLIFSGKSASCMVRKEFFKDVGGFDEDFGILGEETDLAWRLWLINKSVVFCPQATGYHAFNTKFKPIDKYYTSSRVHRNGPRNYLTMLLKNLGWYNLWIVPIHLSIWLIAGCVMALTGKLEAASNMFKGCFDVFKGIWRIGKKRREIQRTRRISDIKLFRYIYKNPPISYYLNRFTRYIKVGLHG